jgi:uncharacterized protein YqeY
MNEPTLWQRIEQDLVAAMKARDAETLSTLRMLKAALLEAKTRKSKDAEMTAAEQIEILQRYVKKRRETIEELKRVGREDLVAREEREIQVVQRYLPAGMAEDELRALIGEVVTQLGAASPRDLGKVMGAVMGRVKGRAEGALVNRLVKEALGG